MAREPYRSPSRPSTRERAPVGPPSDGLDEAALERKVAALRARHRAQEATGRQAEIDGTAFWMRARGALIVVIAVAAGGLGLSSGFHGRGVRLAILVPAFLLTGLWMLVFGAGGAPSYREAPGWVKAGGAIAVILGAAIGLAILFR